MASSGSFRDLYSSTDRVKLSFGWHTVESSMEDNTTTIGAYAIVVAYTNLSNVRWTYNITVDTKTKSGSATSTFQNGGTYYIMSSDGIGTVLFDPIVIPHDADGTKTLDISFTFNFGSVGGTVSYSTSVELDPFERYSTVTASNGVIGSTQVTITIDTATSGRTHKITYAFGSLTGTISSGTTSTSIKWTLPTSFYNQMSEVVSKTGTITISYTIGGNTYTDQCNFTASVSESLCRPTLSPTVSNATSAHVSLTGSVNTLILYESTAQYNIGASARNGAYLVSQSITCGSKTMTASSGTIENVPDGTFVFRAVDSRGFATEKTITKTIKNYIKPTCNQDIRTELVGETTAKVYVTISGNIYNGSFGAVNNTITLQIRYTDESGQWSAWESITDIDMDGHTYTAELSGGNFDYNQNYLIQSRVIDKLYTVESAAYSIRVKPVFDWGKEDFNVNVPFFMNGNPVLRHSINDNDTVLSASGGHVYLRPNGADVTSGEVRITAQGDIEITGDIIVDGVNIITALRNRGII